MNQNKFSVIKLFEALGWACYIFLAYHHLALFNSIAHLLIPGYLGGPYDIGEKRIKKSFWVSLRSYITWALVITYPFKIFVSNLIDKNDYDAQFIVGSWFNYLNPVPRLCKLSEIVK